MLEFNPKIAEDAKIDSFTRGYITALLWSWLPESEDENEKTCEPIFENLSREAIETSIEECKKFQTKNAGLLKKYYKKYKPAENYTVEECAGHDFYLTRCGHGVGFWDRGLGQLGEDLSGACGYSERSLFCNDDDLLYF